MGALDATPGDPEAVAAGLSRLMARGMDVVLAMDGAPAAARVAKILSDHGLDLPVVERFGKGARTGVLADGLHTGVVLPALRIAVLGSGRSSGRGGPIAVRARDGPVQDLPTGT